MDWYQANAFLVLIACVIIVIAEMILTWKTGWTSNSVRIIGITIIAFVGVFAALTVANEKNGPAIFGLLGTVAGYLIGKNDNKG